MIVEIWDLTKSSGLSGKECQWEFKGWTIDPPINVYQDGLLNRQNSRIQQYPKAPLWSILIFLEFVENNWLINRDEMAFLLSEASLSVSVHRFLRRGILIPNGVEVMSVTKGSLLRLRGRGINLKKISEPTQPTSVQFGAFGDDISGKKRANHGRDGAQNNFDHLKCKRRYMWEQPIPKNLCYKQPLRTL